MKAKTRLAGPARAEEVGTESWTAQQGTEYADVVEKVKSIADSRRVKIYKVATGVDKAEYYIVGLDLDGERIVGVQVAQ